MALITDKFVFIHVPKTGGSYCREVIKACCIEAKETCDDLNDEGNPTEEHMGTHATLTMYPELAMRRKFVGFVRHPISWYKSRWAWGVLTKFEDKIPHNSAAMTHWMADVWSQEFTEFIDNVIARGRPRALETFSSKLMVFDKWIDDIGRYEELVTELYRMTKCHAGHIGPQREGARKMNPTYGGGQIKEICYLEKKVLRRFYT